MIKPKDKEFWIERKVEIEKPTFTVRGQVLEVSKDNSQIHLYISGLGDQKDAWISVLPEMPIWALDGTVFKAELSQDVETFDELVQRPWAIRGFEASPTVYMSHEELMKELE